ncbi:MAG: sterol carrier protein [Chloroflexi bacterium]|nr:MAG: sterol carrier protein [Chloroflexota bacterium]
MSQSVPFATDEWVKRLADACNQSEAYRRAARNWEGDLYLVVEPEGAMQSPVYMYLDLYHGQCRAAFIPDDPASLQPEFVIRGPLSAWKQFADEQTDPIKMLLTRKLRLTGNMAKIMRHVRAAHELVNCARTVDTEFPG